MNDIEENEEGGFLPLTSAKVDKIMPQLVKAQSEMGSPKFDKTNPHFKTKYASLGEMYRAAKPALNAHALLLSQPVRSYEVVTRITHTSGQWVQSSVPIITARPGSQDFGSGLTYAKRQGLCSLLAIAGEEDDDGESQARAPKNTKKKHQLITKETAAEVDLILNQYADAKTLGDIKSAKDCVTAIWKKCHDESRRKLQAAHERAEERVYLADERKGIEAKNPKLESAIASAKEGARKAKESKS